MASLHDLDPSVQRELVNKYMASRGTGAQGKSGNGASVARQALINNPDLVAELMSKSGDETKGLDVGLAEEAVNANNVAANNAQKVAASANPTDNKAGQGPSVPLTSDMTSGVDPSMGMQAEHQKEMLIDMLIKRAAGARQ